MKPDPQDQNINSIFFDPPTFSWLDARAFCQASQPLRNGDLASIPDQGTNDLLSSLTSYTSAMTGGYRKDDGKFVWSDGTPFEFENWRPSEPNNGFGSGTEKYIAMENGQWNDIGGTVESFLCQTKGKKLYFDQ